MALSKHPDVQLVLTTNMIKKLLEPRPSFSDGLDPRPSLSDGFVMSVNKPRDVDIKPIFSASTLFGDRYLPSCGEGHKTPYNSFISDGYRRYWANSGEDSRQMLPGELEMYSMPSAYPKGLQGLFHIGDQDHHNIPYPFNFICPPPQTFQTKDFAPKRHKAKITVWADLTVDALDRLNESLNPEHIRNVLADIFVLDNYKESVKTGIVMDLYFFTLQFCREQSFSTEKTSAFFSIIKKVFEVCIETPFGNLDHTFEYFKDLIHCHSVNRPPYSIELFTPDEVRKMTEYTINSFFRHFKMYKYAFTPLVRLDLGINYVGMPPSPPPSEVADATDSSSQVVDGEVQDENKVEEIDEERQAARDELKNIVQNFLGAEAKRIEGNVDNHIKSAVDVLNSKIEHISGQMPKTDAKGKKS